MYSDRKEIGGCLQLGRGARSGRRKELQRDKKKLGNDGYIHYCDYDDGFMNVYIYQILPIHILYNVHFFISVIP